MVGGKDPVCGEQFFLVILLLYFKTKFTTEGLKMWGVIAAVGGVCMAVAVVSYVISEGGDHIMNDNDNDNDNDNGSGGGSDWDPFD